MIVCGYGIRLERLRKNDLELLREKRNSRTVTQFMHFREHISPEMQQQWFGSINNPQNLYYLICVNDRKVGMVNGAAIDWEKGETGSGGIFIWEEELWQTEIPLLANMLMLDISVYLGLNVSKVKILPDNSRAIHYNKTLGYQLMPGQENEANQAYVLYADEYLKKTAAVRQYLQKRYGSVVDLIIDDPEDPITRFLVSRIENLASPYREKFHFVYPG